MESAPDRWRREGTAVAAVTLIGAGLRSWPPGRLGLTHFDEGIYALAASRAFAPGELASIDPSLIPYAPPGYPILAGMAFAILGRSDEVAIAVSQLSGVLTLPVIAWLARRAFGPGAGVAAATLAAFSGPQIAFSRMALTDASSLLAWLVALGLGMRFLERPGVGRAIAMGLAVGMAQQFKYNGWLTGGIVAITAGIGALGRPGKPQTPSLLKTFGWGGFSAGVAWLVVWPWYRFVEGHGGYSNLLRHQRSYLGGMSDWWPHFLIQADEAAAMSGGSWLLLGGSTLCCLSGWVARSSTPIAESPGSPDRMSRALWQVAFGLLPWVLADRPYWLGLILAPSLIASPRASARLVGVWWVVLSGLAPFYHPYARLWLPYHASNWLLMGGLVARGPTLWLVAWNRRGPGSIAGSRPLSIGLLGLVALGASVRVVTDGRGSRAQPDLLAPSDSVRRAASHIASIIPQEVVGLRVLARPPVLYYLAGRVPMSPMSGSDQLRAAGDPRAWALVDWAILRSESGRAAGGSPRELLAPFLDRWEVVEEFPTTLALPTLLDLEPGAARSRDASRSSPLWLLRPRIPGT